MTENEKRIRLLDEAKKHPYLWDGQPLNGKKRPGMYLCCAVSAVVQDLGYAEYQKAGNYIKGRIKQLIHGHVTIEQYYRSLGVELTPQEAQERRIKLAEDIINELKESAE